MRCFALINPHAPLLLEEGLGPNGAEGDFFAFAFELQRITGAEVKLFAEGLGNEDASGAVEGKLRCHSDTEMWENPPLNPILATFEEGHRVDVDFVQPPREICKSKYSIDDTRSTT